MRAQSVQGDHFKVLPGIGKIAFMVEILSTAFGGCKNFVTEAKLHLKQ